MSDDDGIVISKHGADVIPILRAELLSVHEDARSDLIDQPFYSVQEYASRVDLDAAEPGFCIATGRIDGKLVGYAFGISLSTETWWWQLGVQEALDHDLTRETGDRTFCVRELLVRHDWQRRGFGQLLHDALLRDRPEERVTLTAHTNDAPHRLYLKWGYRDVAERALPDGPHFTIMLLDMSEHRHRTS
jgi:GNAT superfamily N-acetyltransferase